MSTDYITAKLIGKISSELIEIADKILNKRNEYYEKLFILQKSHGELAEKEEIIPGDIIKIVKLTGEFSQVHKEYFEARSELVTSPFGYLLFDWYAVLKKAVKQDCKFIEFLHEQSIKRIRKQVEQVEQRLLSYRQQLSVQELDLTLEKVEKLDE
jgi:hypothetical protein